MAWLQSNLHIVDIQASHQTSSFCLEHSSGTKNVIAIALWQKLEMSIEGDCNLQEALHFPFFISHEEKKLPSHHSQKKLPSDHTLKVTISHLFPGSTPLCLPPFQPRLSFPNRGSHSCCQERVHQSLQVSGARDTVLYFHTMSI